MKKFSFLVFAFLMILQVASAQKIKFRKISKEELTEQAHPAEPEAEAAFLYNFCRRYYAYNDYEGIFFLHTEVHQRIKIYTQDGVSWADIAIPFHKEGNISKLKAYTYNMVDGKVVENQLENNNIFTEDINKYTKRKKAAMPSVGPGSVIDIEYEVKEPASLSFRPFYMQYAIPVNYAEYNVEIPEYFTFNKSAKGLPLPMEIKKSTRNGIISFLTPGERSTRPGGTTASSSSSITYNINTETYIAKNVPALKTEPFVTNMSNYRTFINYELSFLRYPGGRSYSYSDSWDNIADKLMISDNFGQQIDARLGDLNDLVETAIALPAEERYKRIYYYVRDNYSWNGYFGEQTDKGLRKLLSDKTGNIAEINLLLINLLKKAQLEVVPVVMSTRENGFLNLTHPSYTQLNYVIALLRLDGKKIYLDATDEGLSAGFLPERALNLDGIVIEDNRKANRIEIENPNTGTTTVIALVKMNEDLSVSGKARITRTDYYASEFKSYYKSKERKEGYQKSLLDRHPDLEIIAIDHVGLDTVANRIIETIEMEIQGQASKTSDMIYLNPMLIWQGNENQFKSEKREFSVFYNSKGIEKYILTITLPEGYAVNSLPEPVKLALPDNLGSFLYSVSENAGTLNVQYQYERKADIIGPEFYEALRAFMMMIVDKQAEKVVLKKTV